MTFKKAEDPRTAAKWVPSDRLLIETDCPFLAPSPFRGKRNEPSYVVEVARCIAELRDVTVQQIGETTTANFNRLFSPDNLCCVVESFAKPSKVPQETSFTCYLL